MIEITKEGLEKAKKEYREIALDVFQNNGKTLGVMNYVIKHYLPGKNLETELFINACEELNKECKISIPSSLLMSIKRSVPYTPVLRDLEKQFEI